MMNIALKSMILEIVRNIQIATKSPVNCIAVAKLIPNNNDIPRRMREMYAEGYLYRTKDGRYYMPSLKRLNSLNRWC